MATYNLAETTKTWHGTGSGWWGETTYNNQNGDNNNLYVGGVDGHYRVKIAITIPSTLKTNGTNKLIVKFKGYGQNSGNVWTLRTRAHLSTTNLTSSDYSGLTNLANLVTSYLYSDEAGENRITGGYSTAAGNDVYIIFNKTDFQAGQTYYIYMIPYGSDSDGIASPTWTSTWMVWQNNPPGATDRLVPTLHYNNTYTVTYNANGGTNPPAAQSAVIDSSLTLSSTAPTAPTGYHSESKWNTKANESGSSYGFGTSYKPPSDITLYAQWNPNPYYIAYNGNGNTGGTTNTSTHYYDAAKNLTSNGFTRSYQINFNSNGGSSANSLTATYLFKGWDSRADGNGTGYTNGQSVTNLTAQKEATVTLYAQWEADSIILPIVSRDGYVFRGWANSQSATIADYAGGTSYTPTANKTLYAVWDEIEGFGDNIAYIKINNVWLLSRH